jgi:hypothetical protein
MQQGFSMTNFSSLVGWEHHLLDHCIVEDVARQPAQSSTNAPAEGVREGLRDVFDLGCSTSTTLL